MQQLILSYNENTDIQDYIENVNLSIEKKYLIKIFTSSLNQEKSVELAKKLQGFFPFAQIVGASSSAAVVYKGEILEDGTLVIIESYESLSIHTETFTWKDLTAIQFAEQVYTAFKQEAEKGNVVHMLFSDRYFDIHAFTEEINQYETPLHLVGGIAGDFLPENVAGFVFTPDGIVPYGAIAFSVFGENAYHYIKPSISQDKVSPVFEITKMDGNTIEEIENQPALDWIFNYLNINQDGQLDDWKDLADNDYLIHFPIMIEGTDGARYTRRDVESDKLALYFSRLPDGVKFRIGYVDPYMVINSTQDICKEVLNTPMESIFAYMCLFRKLYLNNCAKWELGPFRKNNICGLFLMGEVGWSYGKNVFYNGACVFSGIAEKESYIMPNMVALENIESLNDDNNFYSKALEKNRETENNKASNNNIFYNKDVGLYSTHQYHQDNQHNKFDKLCLVEVETADVNISYVGESSYYQVCREILCIVKERLKISQNIEIYFVNYKTFLFAGTKDISLEDFIQQMKAIYPKFTDGKFTKSDLEFVSKFIIVYNYNNLFNSALNAQYTSKEGVEGFLIFDGNKDNFDNEDKERLSILQYAIENDGVVPYYQGIHNNETGKIQKYEALMRLRDKEGNIYSPYHFMEISKKYKYYNKISLTMIDKVLKDFDDIEAEVSINISFYDINSSDFTEWFFNRIKQVKKPSAVCIELLETESLISNNGVLEFLRKCREIGCKIAIDDFGTGYSNFSTVLEIEPDYIKLDGSIVKGIATDAGFMATLDAISFFAQKVSADVIAEFVESAEIQEILLEKGIKFSQGYYYSKPAPFNEIFKQ